MYVWYAPSINSGEPRLQTARRKTDRGTNFILRPHATACNLTLEGGTNIGVIAPLCDDSDPCAENELNDSKLEKLTHRDAMTPAWAMTPACAMTRTITVLRLPSQAASVTSCGRCWNGHFLFSFWSFFWTHPHRQTKKRRARAHQAFSKSFRQSEYVSPCLTLASQIPALQVVHLSRHQQPLALLHVADAATDYRQFWAAAKYSINARVRATLIMHFIFFSPNHAVARMFGVVGRLRLWARKHFLVGSRYRCRPPTPNPNPDPNTGQKRERLNTAASFFDVV